MSPKFSWNGAWTGVAILLMIFLAVFSWKTFREAGRVGVELTPRDTITINGEGKISSEPTLAQVSLGLYSEGASVPVIQDQNSRKVNAIIDALINMGIAKADIQTNNYSIQPKYTYTEGKTNIDGYTVSQSLTVKVRDLSKVGDVISKAGELGSNQVNGVTFTIDDPSSIQQQARAKAIDDARKKAEELAKAMGVSIIKVVTFSESSGNTNPPPIFYARDAVPAAASVSPEIQPGQLDVTANVSVTFEVR